MDEQDKHTLVRLQIEKAHRFLRQADEMFAQKQWDLAANRYYYACYHAVQGLFIARDLPTAKKHSGTVTQFSLHFVKTGLVDSVYGSFLARICSCDRKPIIIVPMMSQNMTYLSSCHFLKLLLIR